MYPEENVTTTPEYSTTDTLYAWLSLAFAFLFCQTQPVTQYPLGGFLLILALFIAGFVVLKLKKQKLSPVCIISSLSALAINLALLLTDTDFLVNLSFTYGIACFCYFLYAALGNRIEEGFSDYIYIDFIKILFLLPFRSLGTIFMALANKSAKKGSGFLLKILIGLAIAIIPTCIVLAYLSYDDSFMKILGDLFTADIEDVLHTLVSLFFTLPLAMYGFGLYRSSCRRVMKDRITAESCQAGLRKAQILPQLTAVVALVPVVFLYVVFFVSQWQYYVSGFTGVLPENFSYAEYARQGFFELCSVSVVNLILIVAVAFFIKRSQKNTSVILKIVAVIFCLCTLILISTAVAKLVMYIDYYGLTQKRIYAMWLMGLIGIVFLLIAVGQFFKKFKTVAVSLTVAIALFAGLAVCNVNALCAQYNAQRYLSGSLETLDISAMKELGDSAIPALVEVATSMDEEKDPELKYLIDLYLYRKQLQEKEDSIFAFRIPTMLAEEALNSYTPNIPPAGDYQIYNIKVNGTSRFNMMEREETLVTLSPDRTGTITYQGQTNTFSIRLDEMTFAGYEEMPFLFSCRWDGHLVKSITASCVYEDDSYVLELKPVF